MQVSTAVQNKVSPTVIELLERSDLQIRNQRRQDRRNLDYVDFIDGLAGTDVINQQEEPEKDWIVVENADEQIIACEVFEMVKELLKRDARTSPKQKQLDLFVYIARVDDLLRAFKALYDACRPR